VIGGTNVPAFDFVNDPTTQTANHLSLAGGTLTVTMNLADLSTTGLTNAFTSVPGSKLMQYVTRWVLCGTYPGGPGGNCKIYYVEAECQIVGCAANTFTFFGGQAASIDLCSVSACDPHVEVYPDAPSVDGGGNQVGGFTLTGSVNATTGAISIQVPASDIGNPSQSSLLEEVGSYSFASAYGQSTITNNEAEADQLPLEIDGVCCFNYQASATPASNVPEAPWTPELLGIGVVLVAAGVISERRRARRRSV